MVNYSNNKMSMTEKHENTGILQMELMISSLSPIMALVSTHVGVALCNAA